MGANLKAGVTAARSNPQNTLTGDELAAKAQR